MTRTPSENKGKDNRDKILRSATRLFGRRGFNGTTIEDVTRESGISKGALYWHYKSKSELLGAVVERLQTEYLDVFTKDIMSAGPRPIDRIRRIFKFNARFAVEHIDLIHCLRNLSLELSPSEDKNVKMFFSTIDQQRNLIVRLINDAQRDGSIRTDLKPEIMAAVILAIHDGILLQWTAFGHLLDGRELVWSFRQIMLVGMGVDPNKESTEG
ncbi:MAG: TetR/AcrR family transcriptional regulator [Pseudomonadota bacterium]